jgi:hypothetical protein
MTPIKGERLDGKLREDREGKRESGVTVVQKETWKL